MKDNTLVTHAGNHPAENQGIINPPVYHASTVLFPTVESFQNRDSGRVRYGRSGTPTQFALEEAMCALERAHGVVLAPSGLAAVTMAVTAFVEAGDHVLVTDTAYDPTRTFCRQILGRFGVETEYYDPAIGAGVADLIRENTRIVFLESPGSLTFEVQDVPAIAKAAKAAGVATLIDNTWSGGYFFKPLDHGVDVSIQAATKYIVGHSDVMMGTIACNEATYDRVRTSARRFGNYAGPDDVYLTTRGLRTLGVRLQRHHESGLRIAEWLRNRPEVIRVLHPGLPQDPGHALWKRDFTGASGLFGFVVDTLDAAKVAALVDRRRYFGIGSSWGGYESLIRPVSPETARSATRWEPGGRTVRIHVGLEDVDDLIGDLEDGFKAMAAA